MDRSIEIVGCHAEGEVGDVIVGGVAPPPGRTVAEQARWIARDGVLRRFVLNEPRGGVFRHVNLLVPPVNPGAAAGWIIMEPEDTPPMSGSNAICVATVLLETGRVAMREPLTRFVLEAPGGLVEAAAECRGGKARRVAIRSLPSFADRLGAPLEVEGLGTLEADTAFGGDTFVLTDAAALGFSLVPDEAADLCRAGIAVVRAAGEQLGLSHPTDPAVSGVSFCQFTAPVAEEGGRRVGRNAVVIRPGKVDRSPTGTGLSARMAVLRARGEMGVGDELTARSLIGSEFRGRIEKAVRLGGRPAIVPSFSGRAWITGRHALSLDPDDPWPEGYRLSDTWPRMPG